MKKSKASSILIVQLLLTSLGEDVLTAVAYKGDSTSIELLYRALKTRVGRQAAIFGEGAHLLEQAVGQIEAMDSQTLCAICAALTQGS